MIQLSATERAQVAFISTAVWSISSLRDDKKITLQF
jgi:hypothetical protein